MPADPGNGQGLDQANPKHYCQSKTETALEIPVSKQGLDSLVKALMFLCVEKVLFLMVSRTKTMVSKLLI